MQLFDLKGTDIGDHRIYKKGSENSAIEQFAEKFLDQTGNTWEERFKFQKKPGLFIWDYRAHLSGKYFMVELDDGHEDDEVEQEIKKVKREKKETKKVRIFREISLFHIQEDKMEVDSKVGGEAMSKRVQDLVSSIFDKEMMKKTLQSMDVDIK